MAKQGTPSKTPTAEKKIFALGKQNYKIMAVGFAAIVVGFLFMLGGGAETPDEFNPALFSFTRITLAPLLVVMGFVIEIYAILWKPKAPKETTPTNA